MSDTGSDAQTGLLQAVRDKYPDGGTDQFPEEEVRFGVILNGGVSLAVWMGGGVLELDRLTRASRDPAVDKTYDTLLKLCGCSARADVIAGTSAGGINGAALALSQVNQLAELNVLRDIWSDQGRIEALLRQPFKGSPASLLQGDEYFLPSLNLALGRLASPASIRSRDDAPIDLTITTTVLRGNQSMTVDALGQRLPQTLHAGRFRWQRFPDTVCAHRDRDPVADTPSRDELDREAETAEPANDSPDTHLCPRCDPFSAAAVQRTAHRLALASRCTASFPVAFEPVFVPVGSPLHAEPPNTRVSDLTEAERLRPDMDGFVRDWGDEGPARDRSRFVVDGGVLANTPTLAALEAVQAMPAEGPVRRVMLLIYPHAGQPAVDEPDQQHAPPSVVGELSGLLGALTAQGSRTFVDELEQHNQYAAGRRGVRNDILTEEESAASLQRLARAIWPQYQRLRRWRAGRDLAERAVGLFSPQDSSALGHQDTWGFERIRLAARRGQDKWKERRLQEVSNANPSDSGPFRPQVPYFPDEPPKANDPRPDGWAWGVSTAIGITDAAADLLRRLVWVQGEKRTDVATARREVSRLSTAIREKRHLLDSMWEENQLLTSMEPNEDYWMLRLASYERLMLGWPPDAAEAARAEFKELIATVCEARHGAGRAPTVGEVEHVLCKRREGSVGREVRGLVDQVLDQVLIGLRALPDEARDTADVLGDQRVELNHWRRIFRPGASPPARRVLLHRLLLLEVANTALGDEARTGADIPVEIVQLSAHTRNAFAEYTHTADDKLGGWSLNRFGGFVKRSWRVNDWTWGRVDAATVLCRTLLHPARIRRTAVLSGFMPTSPGADRRQPDAARNRARDTVDGIVQSLFDEATLKNPRLEELRTAAAAELTDVFNPDYGTSKLPSSLPHLADLFAWALHLRIVPEELPALAGAIRADRVDGANARSRGETFLEEHGDLLSRLSAPSPKGPVAQDRSAAIAAFDRAGIGREPWNQEASSDLIIRSATTAAAVAATVVDSDRSGLSVVKPVTRLMRGGMLLPYWTVTGLTSRATLPRTLALLALSLGGTVLALALFGVLPEGISGPATALGVSAVLVAFAYGAMRSGTMLHGLMLLTPVIALVAGAIAQLQTKADENSEAAAQQGLATMAVVLVLAVALIVLGSIPATTGSVWTTLDRLADRVGVPPLTQVSGARRRGQAALRRVEGLVRALLALVPAAIVLGLLAAITWWIAGKASLEDVRKKVREADFLFLSSPAWMIGLLIAILAFGAVYSNWQGGRLRVLQRAGTRGNRQWSYARVTEPAGAAAGWAVVYGAGYLVIALLLVWRPSGEPPNWAAALLVSSLLLGTFLVFVAPFLFPRNALARFEQREADRALEAPEPELYAVDLVERGLAYHALVKQPRLDRGEKPRLTQRGRRLENRLRLARLRIPAAAAETKMLAPTIILLALVAVGVLAILMDATEAVNQTAKSNIAAAAALIALIAAGVAFLGRRRLDVLLDTGGSSGLRWDDSSPVASPPVAALQALFWSLFYSAVAAFALWNPGGVQSAVADVFAVGAVVVGLFHALFVPSWINRSVLRWTEELEVVRARDLDAEPAVTAAVRAARAADRAKKAARLGAQTPWGEEPTAPPAVESATSAATAEDDAKLAAIAAEEERVSAEAVATTAEDNAKTAETDAKTAANSAAKAAKAADGAAERADEAADRAAALTHDDPGKAAAESAADAAAEAAAEAANLAAESEAAASAAGLAAVQTAEAAEIAEEALKEAATVAAQTARTAAEATAQAASAAAIAAAEDAETPDFTAARVAARTAVDAAAKAAEAATHAYALSLVERKRAYRTFVRRPNEPGGRPPTLARRGRKLLTRAKGSVRRSAAGQAS